MGVRFKTSACCVRSRFSIRLSQGIHSSTLDKGQVAAPRTFVEIGSNSPVNLFVRMVNIIAKNPLIKENFLGFDYKGQTAENCGCSLSHAVQLCTCPAIIQFLQSLQLERREPLSPVIVSARRGSNPLPTDARSVSHSVSLIDTLCLQLNKSTRI